VATGVSPVQAELQLGLALSPPNSIGGYS